MKRRGTWFLSWVCWVALSAVAAVGQGTKDDYARTRELPRKWRAAFDVGEPDYGWTADGRLWLSTVDEAGLRAWDVVDPRSGTRKPLFDAKAVATVVGARLGGVADARRLPIVRVDADADGCRFLVDGLDAAVFAPADGGAPTMRAFEDEPRLLISQSGVQESRRRRRGRNGERETAVWVANRTARPLELIWRQGGERTSYGEIRPGAVRRQHTFTGHRWSVRDGERVVAEFDAEASPAVVVVTGEDPSAPQAVFAPPRPKDAGPRPTNRVEEYPRKRPGQVRIADGSLVVSEAGREKSELLRTPWSHDKDDVVADDDVSVGRDRLVLWRTRRLARPDAVNLPAAGARGSESRKTVLYPRPGDARDLKVPHLYDTKTNAEIAVDRALFRDPYDLRDTAWSVDGRRYSFVYVQRGHRVVRLVEIDAETGAVRTLIEDAPPTFVDTAHAFYFQRFRSTAEALWMSERDGWRGLYLFDLQTGAQKARLTGDWVVDGVERVDEQARQVWFRARGAHPGQDPYHLHFGRVDFDGKNLVWLTDADGTHEIEYSPDGSLYLDRWSRVDQPPVLELRRTADGSKVAELARASDADLRAAGWKPPERFVAKATDGTTDLWGVVFRPSNFDPAKKYPVVEHVYAGPQGFFTPKAFDVWHHHRELAELGFIVVQLDAPGTAGRSKAFHDACWMNVADAGLKDRVAWIKALGAKHPECDLSRVGIYGTSAGGQTALRALLMHGDFYRAGVADCGCHDNRVDKQWWNEQWMGYPVGPHYAEQSNVTQAHRLSGDLLLMVGEVDTNVDPACTMQVVDALVKADKDFELLVAPGVGHGVVGTPYGKRRLLDFFVRKLLKVEPRRNSP